MIDSLLYMPKDPFFMLGKEREIYSLGMSIIIILLSMVLISSLYRNRYQIVRILKNKSVNDIFETLKKKNLNFSFSEVDRIAKLHNFFNNSTVKFHKVVDAFICIVTKTQRTWGNVMSP